MTTALLVSGSLLAAPLAQSASGPQDNKQRTEQINKQTPHNNAQAQKKAQPTPKKQATKKQNDRNGAPKHTAKKNQNGKPAPHPQKTVKHAQH